MASEEIRDTEYQGYRVGESGRILGPSGRWLKPSINKDGYHSVSIYHFGLKLSRTVHGLVCRAWYGAPPPGMFQVRHLDGNPYNNTPGNLRWGDQSENEYDKVRHGTHGGNRGEKHGSAKLTNEDVREIRRLYADGTLNQYELADQYGVAQSVISQIWTRQLWSHLKDEEVRNGKGQSATGIEDSTDGPGEGSSGGQRVPEPPADAE